MTWTREGFHVYFRIWRNSRGCWSRWRQNPEPQSGNRSQEKHPPFRFSLNPLFYLVFNLIFDLFLILYSIFLICLLFELIFGLISTYFSIFLKILIKLFRNVRFNVCLDWTGFNVCLTLVGPFRQAYHDGRSRRNSKLYKFEQVGFYF